MTKPDGMRQEVYEGLVVARTLREELGLRDDQPVACMVEIAEERLAVDVILVPLREAVSGFYLPVRPHPVVVVSDHHPVSRQRFTLAHEIAHHALGHGAAPRIQETPKPVDDAAAGGVESAGSTAGRVAIASSTGGGVESPGPTVGGVGNAGLTASAVGSNANRLGAEASQRPKQFGAKGMRGAPRTSGVGSRSPDASWPATGPAPSSHYTPQRAPDPNERAANAFAGELLVPDSGARRLLAAWATEPLLDQCVRLSAHYGISAFAASVKLQMLGLIDRDAATALRTTFASFSHVARYDELALPALDDQLQRHRDAGGGIRCAPRARTALRRILGELAAAS